MNVIIKTICASLNLYSLHKQIEETFFWWFNNKKQSAMLKRTNVAKNVVCRLWRFLCRRENDSDDARTWKRKMNLLLLAKKWHRLQLKRFIQSKKLASYLQSTKKCMVIPTYVCLHLSSLLYPDSFLFVILSTAITFLL